MKLLGNRLLLLSSIMAAIAFIVTGVAMLMLYAVSFEQAEQRLLEAARSHARLIGAVARYDRQTTPDDLEGATRATISQIREGLGPLHGTVEITVAHRVGGDIVFLLQHESLQRHQPTTVLFDSPLAEPMRRALMGQTGTVVGLDHHDEMVLAAYAPVPVLGLGIVVKMDLAEVRAPFVRAGLIVTGIAIAVVLLGTALFLRVGEPMIRRLRESEARYKTLFENAGVSIWNEDFSGVRRELERLRGEGVTDLRQYLEANKDAAWAMLASIKVTEVNEATLKLFGAETEQEFIESIDNVFTPGAIDVFIDEACAIWERKVKIFQSEASHKTLSGEELTVIISIPIPETEEDFRSVPVSILDITDRKQAEDALRQAQRMEAVGQLTGGVAHDFNNLLAVMLGNAELLELGAGAAESQRHLAEIKGAVLRGSSLTQRLLAFSRQQMLSPVSTDVSGLIDGLHDMLRRSLGEAIDLRIEGTPGLWPVLIDPHQFENALINLAVNARDAMPGGGTLVIETTNVTLDESYAENHEEVTPGDYVKVAVSDVGAGMPDHVLERAFEPFFTTKEAGQGSGLGLSMVYGFVKQSNGHVTIYSEVGHGTTVKLYLPRSREAPVTLGAEEKTPELAPGSAHILVVEDDPDVRAVPAAILRAQGYEVTEAADGKQAIDHLEAGPPFDLLFTDIVLPGGINGVEIAAEAKRLQPGIKVIYTTGYAEHAIVHSANLDPDAIVLTKPYRRADLLEKIHAALAGDDD